MLSKRMDQHQCNLQRDRGKRVRDDDSADDLEDDLEDDEDDVLATLVRKKDKFSKDAVAKKKKKRVVTKPLGRSVSFVIRPHHGHFTELLRCTL